MMEKISAAQVNEYLLKCASTIRSQQAQIKDLQADKESRDRRDHAEKIASVAVDRGLLEAEEAAEYAEHLVKGDEDLKMVEDFMGRRAAGVPLGQVKEKTASAETGTGELDVLTAFLLSSDQAG